ncbi:MAG: hypothetical protein ACE5H9_12300 [Anaerolineae bacterium]
MQALAHLRDLSEISPFNPDTEKKALNEQGAIPWTDTRPSPDWLSLAAGAVFILAFLACLYGYLFIGLANRL